MIPINNSSNLGTLEQNSTHNNSATSALSAKHIDRNSESSSPIP